VHHEYGTMCWRDHAAAFRPWLPGRYSGAAPAGLAALNEARGTASWSQRMLAGSLGYVARGADSVLFFQWRASRAGAETYHLALVPHGRPDIRIFREAVATDEQHHPPGQADEDQVRASVPSQSRDASRPQDHCRK
jgi:beta-galactosidase GanA